MPNERPKSNWSFIRFCTKAVQIVYMAIVTIFMVIFYQKAKDESKKSQVAHQELLRLRRKNAQDGDRCCVCLNNPLEILVKPCGHICICFQCSQQLQIQSPKCPICRENVTSTERVYIS